MDLINVPIGTELGIELSYNGVSLRRVTTILVCKNNILLCEPIFDDSNEPVEFEFGSDISCNVRIAMEGYEAQMYQNVQIRTCVWQGESYIVLANARPSLKSNRREAYRQYIGLNGVVKRERDEINVRVRDLSMTGVAFICNKEYNGLCNIDDEVNVEFEDIELDRGLNLLARVVRIDDYTDDNIILGCLILTSSSSIGNYVAIKQAQELCRG